MAMGHHTLPSCVLIYIITYGLLTTETTAQDIDDCSEDKRICGINFVCINGAGSYSCVCKEGYKPAPGESRHCVKGPSNQDARDSDSLPLRLGITVGVASLILLGIILMVVVVLKRKGTVQGNEDPSTETPVSGTQNEVTNYDKFYLPENAATETSYSGLSGFRASVDSQTNDLPPAYIDVLGEDYVNVTYDSNN